MRYEARVTAYDVMDQVAIALVVVGQESTGLHTSVPLLTRSTTVQGTGEPDVEEWVRDALVALLETL